jgi:hypothetical protein
VGNLRPNPGIRCYVTVEYRNDTFANREQVVRIALYAEQRVGRHLDAIVHEVAQNAIVRTLPETGD